MKEAFDNIGLFLHAPKVGNSLPFHALFCEMLEFSHDSGLEISGSSSSTHDGMMA